MATPSAVNLLKETCAKFDQAEAVDVINVLKRSFPKKSVSFDEKGLLGALEELHKSGAIDPDDGDTKLLELLTEKTSKKKEVLHLISDYKKSTTCKNDFVGRKSDMDKIVESFKIDEVPLINLYGESGVGKTTLAKELSKNLKDFKTIFIDLRNIKDMKTVYFGLLQELYLPSWDYNKERIYNHLQSLTTKTLLILDDIEQLLFDESKNEQETKAKFKKFLNVIIGTEASKKGHLKVVLTSRKQISDPALKGKLFTEYNVQPFSKDVSKDFISKRVKSDVSNNEQDEAISKIAKLCGNNPFLLQTAVQLMRERYTSPVDVLRKITTHKEKGVPEKFACINALFDSLPSDHLRQLAVKISLLRRPFSVSTAMKIAEISSDYDARWDLEMLVNHKIITAEDVEGKRKYDLHALFREFVTSHLCEKDSVYKEQLKKGEEKFAEHFSGILTTLAEELESEFVKTYSKLEENRANFELAIELSQENKEVFDLLLHTDDLNQFAMMGILFEVLKDEKERRKLFGEWADAAETQGQWFTSALMRCWQSIQGSDAEGTSNENILEKAEASIDKLQSVSPEKRKDLKSLFLHCRGKVKWMRAEKMNAEQKRRKKKLLEEGIDDLQQAVDMRRKLNGDSTLTSRALNLIGNCYMGLENPLSASKYYQEAMEMKKRLVGSERHWEFPTYYNQMAEVHEMFGRKEDEKWYHSFFRPNFKKAVEWMQKALIMQDELGVSDTLHTANFQENIANNLIELEEYDQALEHAQESYKIRNTLLGKHPETVRILYLIGIIHEWRKDLKAALQSYEKAFEMEESLPPDNHSVVRKKLCDKLEEMCGKLMKKDKLKEYGPRTEKMRKIEDVPLSSHPSEVEEDKGVTSVEDDKKEDTDIPSTSSTDEATMTVAEAETPGTDESYIELNKEGGHYDLSRKGFFVYVPPNAVTQTDEITYSIQPDTSQPSPAAELETVVSYIVTLGPPSVQLSKPITVSLMHSGPGIGYGYESVVKAFNQDNGTWEEIEELKRETDVSKPWYCATDYIQVQIHQMTTLAVVSRLITDSFEVTTDKTCVVRSSVCNDVTIEFPEGAVDKTMDGTLKLLLMPKDILKEHNAWGCPIIFVDGFNEYKFHKSVTVHMPHPCPARYSTNHQARLFRLINEEWKDITDQTKYVWENSSISFKVQQFSALWLVVFVAGAVVTEVALNHVFEDLLKSSQQLVSFGVLKKVDEPLHLKLFCISNHKKDEIGILQDQGYVRLGESTSDKPLRRLNKVDTTIEGGFEKKFPTGDLCLTFDGDNKVEKQLVLREKKNTGTQEKDLSLLFDYKN